MIIGHSKLKWIVACAIGVAVWSVPSLSAVMTLEDLPNGIINGKSDAKYGSYNSTVSQQARAYQNRLIYIESKIHGLASISDKPVPFQSEAGFVLEFELVKLHQDVANAPKLTEFERESFLMQTIRLYQEVRTHAERLYENTIRFIDIAIPGPNGQQIKTESPGKLDASYEPNYRSDNDLNQVERQTEYNNKLQNFLKKGGNLAEIKTVTPEYLKSLGTYTRVEYVQLENLEIRVTELNAGHVLLAAGQRVLSAGQIVWIKNNKGEFTWMIVTNASGNYKPDIYSALRTKENLEVMTGLTAESTSLTKGEPLSTQIYKVYQKGLKEDSKITDIKIKEMDSRAVKILKRSAGGSNCGMAFL